ncbi:MAG: hypothetical protein JXR07_14055 [Reichenbachiella sp.]
MSFTEVKTCPSCATEFTCLTYHCWCSVFPTLLPLKDSFGCLCAKCMKASIKKEIELFMDSLTSDRIKQIQALGKPNEFIEGIDYNINNEGAWVFSSWYLLRQGYCCGNGCTNCPYPVD